MNRIILIGNGFDRAHGLPTSYKDFIDDFWRREARKIEEYDSKPNGNGKVYEDLYIHLSVVEDQYVNWMFLKNSVNSFSDFENIIEKYNEGRINTRAKFIVNKFLEYISRVSSLQNWVDIEDTYHKFLNAIHREEPMPCDGKDYGYVSAKDLHKDFENVRKALEEYLIEVMKGEIAPISKIKYESSIEFYFQDFTSKGKDVIVREEYEKLQNISSQTYSQTRFERFPAFEEMGDEEIENVIRKDLSSYVRATYYNPIPNKTLFLNFNYTNLEELYVDYCKGDKTIHIHGELNNPNNPMIFGYGDEIGEEYKELEKLNDNEYLENIKSIKYLETSNYKNLLSFVDSEEYQIFIFGHSCGNSDRTLLNRLFEHENCVSIKVFYHGSKEKNNYSDVIRNVSRNFNDKTSFREKVVNKEYSEALPQASKTN